MVYLLFLFHSCHTICNDVAYLYKNFKNEDGPFLHSLSLSAEYVFNINLSCFYYATLCWRSVCCDHASVCPSVITYVT